MGKSNIGIFLFLLLCSGFLFTFSQIGPLAYEQVFGEPRTYDAGTMVGPIPIEDLTREEAKQKLANQVLEWKDTHNVMLDMKDQNVVFQKDFIGFDIPETLNQVEDGTENYFTVDMNESYLDVLQNKVGADLYDHILIDKLSEEILARAETLHKEPLHFSIFQYVEDGTTELYEVVSEYSVEKNADMDVTPLVEALNGAEVRNQTPFSLLSFVEDDMSQPSLNAVATAVYGAALETNFMIKQRHISTKLPSYAELGKEASVQQKHNHDLVFTNPNEQSYQLNISEENERLIVKILGYPLPNSYEISLENSRNIKPRTIVQFSERVPNGQSNIKIEGREGTSVEVYRFVEDKDNVIRKDFISDDYYPPVNRVEVRYGANDKPPETETNPTNNSGDNPSEHNQNPSSAEEDQTNNSNDFDSQNGENESGFDKGNEGNASGNGEKVAPEDVWEEPQGNTKDKEK